MSTKQKSIITWLVMAVMWGITFWFLISTAVFHYLTPTPYSQLLLGIAGICVVIRFILAR